MGSSALAFLQPAGRIPSLRCSHKSPHLLRRLTTTPVDAVSSAKFSTLSGLTIAARGPEAIQEDPFLVSLALTSIVLLVFVTGGIIFLTAAERSDAVARDNPEQAKKTKSKLPTLAELDGDDDDDDEDASQLPNRYSRRLKKKRKRASRGNSDQAF